MVPHGPARLPGQCADEPAPLPVVQGVGAEETGFRGGPGRCPLNPRCTSPKAALCPRRGRGQVSRSGQRKAARWAASGRVPSWIRWPWVPKQIEVDDGGGA